MKFITLLLLPFIGFSQIKLNKVNLLENKVEISVPVQLSKISDEMWKLKYRTNIKPILALSDADGEVNFIADLTDQPAKEAQIAAYKDFRIEQLKKSRTDLTFLDNGVKTINGKKVGYFKFLSQAIDQKVFNYYFFTIVNGKILFLTFNCIEKLQKDWEKIADEILASLKIK